MRSAFECIHEALANVVLLLLRVYRALLSVYRALLSVYRALLNMFSFEYIQNTFIARIHCA